MTPQAWCVRLAFVACAGAVTACSFDLADVVTDAPEDGGTFDVAPGGEAEAGGDDSGAQGGPDAATADAPPNGDGGGTDAPADTAPDTAQPDTGNAGTRVTNGIVVLYTFKEGSGTVVHDVSGVAPAYDLTIGMLASTTWLAAGLRIDTPGTVLANVQVATKVRTAITTSNEITMEAWTTPGAAIAGHELAAIMELGRTNQADFELGQAGSKWIGTLHMPGGVMIINAASNVSPTQQTHYVVTRDAAGAWVTYINGAETASGTIAGALGAAWDDSSPYTIGNSHNGTDAYVGLLSLAAVYSRALSQQEVVQNYNVGP